MIGFVHPFTIRALGSTPTVDSEGRVVREAPVDTVRVGRVDELNARDVQIAAAVGQTHDIVVLDTLDSPVTHASSIVVTEPERLAGTYTVDSIRTTRRHIRILCSRDENG